jgi:hypothetical protein
MQIRLSREFLESQLANLYLTKYNCFQWWRRYESREVLSKKAPLYDKIKNGDYEFSNYLYQAEYELHLLEDKLQTLKCPDKRFDTTSLSMERYRRLMIDYQKEETTVMNKMKMDFCKTLKIDKADLEQIMESFDGTTLQLYNHIKNLKNDTHRINS